MNDSPVKTENTRSIAGYYYTWDDYIIIIIPVFMYRQTQQMPGMTIIIIPVLFMNINEIPAVSERHSHFTSFLGR